MLVQQLAGRLSSGVSMMTALPYGWRLSDDPGNPPVQHGEDGQPKHGFVLAAAPVGKIGAMMTIIHARARRLEGVLQQVGLAKFCQRDAFQRRANSKTGVGRGGRAGLRWRSQMEQVWPLGSVSARLACGKRAVDWPCLGWAEDLQRRGGAQPAAAGTDQEIAHVQPAWIINGESALAGHSWRIRTASGYDLFIFFKAHAVQLVIHALLFEQLFVLALFDNLPIIEQRQSGRR